MFTVPQLQNFWQPTLWISLWPSHGYLTLGPTKAAVNWRCFQRFGPACISPQSPPSQQHQLTSKFLGSSAEGYRQHNQEAAWYFAGLTQPPKNLLHYYHPCAYYGYKCRVISRHGLSIIFCMRYSRMRGSNSRSCVTLAVGKWFGWRFIDIFINAAHTVRNTKCSNFQLVTRLCIYLSSYGSYGGTVVVCGCGRIKFKEHQNHVCPVKRNLNFDISSSRCLHVSPPLERDHSKFVPLEGGRCVLLFIYLQDHSNHDSHTWRKVRNFLCGLFVVLVCHVLMNK